MISLLPRSLAVASALAAILPIALSAAPTIEETTLLPDASSAILNISPSGAHVAAIIPKGSRQAVVYDGVEGPRFDQVQTGLANYAFTGTGGRAEPRTSSTYSEVGILGPGASRSVVFTPDGGHWAYAGRSGNEFALMLDGNEFHRGACQQISWLAFAPGNTRLVAAATHPENGQTCIIVDGKAGPWGADISEVFFSPDGAHYAYNGRANDATQTRWTVVDGKHAKFIGDLVGFLPSGVLLSRASASGVTILLANGKPISQVGGINHLAIDPVSGRLIMLVTPPAGSPPTRKPPVLTVDGQIIAGTEDIGVNGVWFSPDGKRYAVLCQRTNPRQEAFMIVDGKRELSYQSISSTSPMAPSFSADSSSFLYVATSSNGQTFVVVNGEESDGVQFLATHPVWSPAGARLAWGGTAAPQRQVFFLDGKAVPLPNNTQPGSTFRFSPDGSRTTWSFGPANALTLVVDGAPLPGIAGTGFTGSEAVDGMGATVKFSPDGRHMAVAAREPTDFSHAGIWLNGKLITPTTRPQVNRATFTPDSRHVFWAMMDVQDNVGVYRIHADGQQAVVYASSPLDNMRQAWDMGADGVLTLLALDKGALRRFRITPGPETSIDTMIAAGSPAAASTASTNRVSTFSTR